MLAAGPPAELTVENCVLDFTAVIFSENYVRNTSAELLADTLDQACVDSDLGYCFLVPKATSMNGRGARHPDEAGVNEDLKLKNQLAVLLSKWLQ